MIKPCHRKGFFSQSRRFPEFGTFFVYRLAETNNTVYMNPKILLVDDNEDLLLITQIILKGQGYDIVLARSLEEAHRKVKIHQPVMAMLDVSLGDGDGREFCEELKRDESTNHIKVIMMSGDDSETNRNTCADAFLPKPFDFNDLVETVHQLMSYETA